MSIPLFYTALQEEPITTICIFVVIYMLTEYSMPLVVYTGALIQKSWYVMTKVFVIVCMLVAFMKLKQIYDIVMWIRVSLVERAEGSIFEQWIR